MPATPERVGYRTAEQQPAHGRCQDDQREGDREEVESHEGQDREGHEDGVVERALADPKHRLDYYRYDDGLDAVEQAVDSGHVRVGDREVGEQPQYEDRRYDEE